MFHGRYQPGEEITFHVLATDANGRPAAPDSFPRLAIYTSTGHPLSDQRMPVRERPAVTGLFYARLYLDETYPEGSYTAVFRWAVSAHHGSVTVPFEVLPGGDTTGQVIALRHYPRPQASYLVQQRTGGTIQKGKNPRR